jgi:hypothetical protein
MVQSLLYELEINNLFGYPNSMVKKVFFAGLPSTCKLIQNKLPNKVTTFSGGEGFFHTLIKLGVDEKDIPKEIIEGSLYDENLYKIAKDIIDQKEYIDFLPINRKNYLEYGTRTDSVIKRLAANKNDDFYLSVSNIPLNAISISYSDVRNQLIRYKFASTICDYSYDNNNALYLANIQSEPLDIGYQEYANNIRINTIFITIP